MSNVLQLIAEDTEELLNAGAYGTGALMRVQTAATYAGAYADLTGTGATPTIALVSGQRTYTGYDPAGAVTSWYKTRFENAGGTRVSDWSAAFQVAPAGLCTDGQVKARVFPAGVTDTADDPLIAELIAEVTAWIASYTGRTFTAETAQTYIIDGPITPGYVLHVPKGVRSLSYVGIATSDQPDTGGTYTSIPPADILLRPAPMDIPAGWPPTELRISRASSAITYWPATQNGVKLTGDFGFAAVPRDIEAVAIDAVVAAYASRKNGASSVMGADETALPPWAAFFGRGSPQRGTLDRYRVYSV